jgi:hypothetical protein
MALDVSEAAVLEGVVVVVVLVLDGVVDGVVLE